MKHLKISLKYSGPKIAHRLNLSTNLDPAQARPAKTFVLTTDYGRPMKSRTFGLGQTNLTDKFWGIWGIFGRNISTHFGFLLFKHYLYEKLNPSQIFILDWDLNLAAKNYGFSLPMYT